MLAMEMKLKAFARRHPRFALFLAGIIRRSPGLRDYVARRYNIRLDQGRPADPETQIGYRLPLARTLDTLTPRARRIAADLQDSLSRKS